MALFFHRLEIGFINSRVKSDEWKKGTSSGFNLVPRFSLSLARSVKRVGENPGTEVAVASSIISGAGDGEGKRSLFSFFFFFFKFVATKYVLNWRGFPTKTHP